MPRRPRAHGPQRITTLIELVKLRVGSSFADVSSSALGEALGVTQQAASRRLMDLEGAGLVERAHSGRGLAVRLTGSGLRAAEEYYAELRRALEGQRRELSFRGSVFTGLGEGGYYVSLKGYSKPFMEALGFEPFAGTLNLRLSGEAMVEQRRSLGFLGGVEVAGFEDGRRSYGPVKCFRALVGSRHPGAVLAIERTHYDSTVLEVISPLNLRKALRLRDGDECQVTVYLG
jgi:riboflavin kinase, archaea type